MTIDEYRDWIDNVVDFLCATHDCPDKVRELQGKINCADYEGECNELECWLRLFEDKIYNRIGGMI